MKATKEMCFLCFETLENGCLKTSKKIVANSVIPPNDTTKCPMFVTWKMDGGLRGCIGIFNEIPLWSGLQEYAITAGMKDWRFPAITANELTQLECGISLLHSFEDAKDVLDWEVGVHGIRLFIDGHSSTYLPEVAPEQGWDKEKTLKQLAKKGGFSGTFDKAAMGRAKLQRYQSSKIKASWAEYQEYVKNHQ